MGLVMIYNFSEDKLSEYNIPMIKNIDDIDNINVSNIPLLDVTLYTSRQSN